jgi:hypothetical protein
MAIDFVTLARMCEDGGYARAAEIALENVAGQGAFKAVLPLTLGQYREKVISPNARKILANWRFEFISRETMELTHTLRGSPYYAVSYGRFGDFSYSQLGRLEEAGCRIEHIRRSEMWPEEVAP